MLERDVRGKRRLTTEYFLLLTSRKKMLSTSESISFDNYIQNRENRHKR